MRTISGVLTESWPVSTTRTPTGRTRRPRSASKRCSTPTMSSPIPRRGGNTTKAPVPSSAPVPLQVAEAVWTPTSPTCRTCSVASATYSVARVGQPRSIRGEDVTVSVNLKFKELEGVTTRIAAPVEEVGGAADRRRPRGRGGGCARSVRGGGFGAEIRVSLPCPSRAGGVGVRVRSLRCRARGARAADGCARTGR